MEQHFVSIGELLCEFLHSDEPLAIAIRDAITKEYERDLKATPLYEWVDTFDVMKALHISQRTLQTMRSNGIIPYTKVRNKIFYRRCDIEKMLEDGITNRKGGTHD